MKGEHAVSYKKAKTINVAVKQQRKRAIDRAAARDKHPTAERPSGPRKPPGSGATAKRTPAKRAARGGR